MWENYKFQQRSVCVYSKKKLLFSCPVLKRFNSTTGPILFQYESEILTLPTYHPWFIYPICVNHWV